VLVQDVADPVDCRLGATGIAVESLCPRVAFLDEAAVDGDPGLLCWFPMTLSEKNKANRALELLVLVLQK